MNEHVCNCKKDFKVPVKFYSVDDIRDIELAQNEKRNCVKLQDLKYAKFGDACVDIRSSEKCTIHANSHELIHTGLYVAIPVGWEIQVRPRSGISAKTPLIMKNTIGTIDAGYRGELMVMFHNLSDQPITIDYGDRIAQIKVERVVEVDYIPVETLDELVSIGVNRGGGLGHTGLE